MLGLTVPFLFPLCLCQRELKLDMVVNSLVVWFGLWPSSLVVWVGFCHVELAPTRPAYDIVGGINVPMVFLPGLWNLVTINASRLYVGFWDILTGQLRSFLVAP